MASVICTVLSVVSPLGALAADIHIVIQGQTVSCTAGATTCPIANTYSGLTIANANGRTAQVQASDSSSDELKLVDALVTATSGDVTGTINFWRDFDGPPDAPPATAVRFERSTSGRMMRTPTTAPYPGAWFKIDAKAKGDSIATPTTKNVICGAPASCGDFGSPAMTKSEDHTSLTGTREMKVELSFKLPLANDQVRIDTAYVKSWQLGGEVSLDEILKGLGVVDGEPCKERMKEQMKGDKGGKMGSSKSKN
jgi:hypothetical protein